jgi:regulator of sirC expression with transglutaminase-like and TPR domain
MDAVRLLDDLGLIEDEDIRLDEACVALALADRPQADAASARATFESMARRLADRDLGRMSARDQARLLETVVAIEEGFRGDTRDYDAPENADWLHMFARRRGLPVTLSLLYVALARRAGWMAEALGLPGHVIVRIGRPGTHAFIDPFEGGRLLDDAGVAALVRRAVGHGAAVAPEHVSPMSNRAALVRLLTNQAGRARKAGDVTRALVLTRRMTEVAPSVGHAWWERARLEQLLGNAAGARHSLAAMRETTHDAGVKARIDAAVNALAR